MTHSFQQEVKIKKCFTYSDQFSVAYLAIQFMSHAQIRLERLSILDKLSESSLNALRLRLIFERSDRGLSISSERRHYLEIFAVRVLATHAHCRTSQSHFPKVIILVKIKT